MHDHHVHHAAGTPEAGADRRYLVGALAILIAFMLAEVAVGVLASSLALISDAGHMLTDAGAIALSLWAVHLARRPAQGRYTFGWKRAEILSAQANGITLLLLALWFVIAAIQRLLHPPQVTGHLVVLMALIGIAVNFAVVWVMRKANRQSLNIQGSFQHILTDLYAFIATAIAGGIVWWTGWDRADALAALLVAALMARAGIGLVRASGRVFLEAAPSGLEPDAIARAICQTDGLVRVDDLHVWELTSGMPALSAHLRVRADVDCHAAQHAVQRLLTERYGIQHVTLQTEHTDGDDVSGDTYACAFNAAAAPADEAKPTRTLS